MLIICRGVKYSPRSFPIDTDSLRKYSNASHYLFLIQVHLCLQIHYIENILLIEL